MKLGFWIPAILLAALNLCAVGEGKGQLQINLTNVLGHDLAGRVVLEGSSLEQPYVIDVPKGNLTTEAPLGSYKAYVYVYTEGVPVLVDRKEVTVTSGNAAYVLLNLVEGSGSRPLLAFDQDCDFALDSVEIACGTDPANAGSVPGAKPVPSSDKVIQKKEGWYRGDLHVHSKYGGGKESVGEVVRRAEKDGLDFLAIADRNTLASCFDPGFKSDKVVLIPAMEWGTDEMGVALVYGPKTVPTFDMTIPQGQALVDMVQAQGGFFGIAHPCFPTSPWQWGLGYVNGVEVWCRDWMKVPPMSPEMLNEDMTERVKGKYIQSIALAAAMRGLSANGQANIFYDSELLRGLKAAAIAGSNSASKDVPMARPVTYVYALEKSVPGILDGMRRGRTFVSSGLDGPKISFDADVMDDGKVDVSLGGIIPLSAPTRFAVGVEGAKGKELQVLCNGYPVVSKTIESDPFALHFREVPDNYSVYRVRVIASAADKSFTPVDVLAISSPIYAQEMKVPDEQVEEYKAKHRRMRDSQKEIQLPDPNSGGQIPIKWRF